MCLTATSKATRNMKKRLDRKGFVIAYKMVKKEASPLERPTPIQTPFMDKEVQVGWLISDRKKEKVSFDFAVKKDFCGDWVEADYDRVSPNDDYGHVKNYSHNSFTRFVDISRGIHVYTALEDAKNEIRVSSVWKYAVLAVKCFKKDFVAAGTFGFGTKENSAVFSKVFIPKAEYDKFASEV